MPIHPDNRKRYPAHWQAIRAEILERANHCCEGSPLYPDCRAVNYEPHPVTGSRVILTIAHWPDETPENCDPKNLWAWCQRCHNGMDAPARSRRAAETRSRKILGV
jgi:5-methylcytosine-specific restriction endonuclease McrA